MLGAECRIGASEFMCNQLYYRAICGPEGHRSSSAAARAAVSLLHDFFLSCPSPTLSRVAPRCPVVIVGLLGLLHPKSPQQICLFVIFHAYCAMFRVCDHDSTPPICYMRIQPDAPAPAQDLAAQNHPEFWGRLKPRKSGGC